ncbi:hypothetical protein [Flammeovirga pacifica]|uniref:Outer membrane protein beta-barrel domain-containing protein n=1 Tax=Flammeovirga pacifica TaxID=915059 RepID=A0A1S1Z1E0_FLAPC|nr:hypothetical protein [Flammeovirga pacifica]OHX67061.1 hypothetical protein NH26_12245 [Flammeovirga pacifica]
MKNLFIILFTLFSLSVFAQTDEEKAQANNPLAQITAFNLQQYYSPNLTGNSEATSSTYWMRFAKPTGRVLWRASLPFSTFSNPETGVSTSGLGDFDLFAAYLAVSKSKLSIGIGPSVSAPTATHATLGTGKWTAGAAAVAFASLNPQLQVGGLAIWRTDVGGDAQRDDVNILAFQPFAFFQVGKGLYFRSAPTWNFNLEKGTYNVPLGVGVGKIMKINKTVFNFFIEPQYSVLHYGDNQPLLQVYSALNMQF